MIEEAISFALVCFGVWIGSLAVINCLLMWHKMGEG